MRKVFVEAIALIIIMCLIFIFAYTQRYIEDGFGTNTATKGIIWQRTIDLKQYKVIGQGSGLWGNYSLISRSMIQGEGETTSIYER